MLISRSLSIAISRSPVVRQKFGKVPLPPSHSMVSLVFFQGFHCFFSMFVCLLLIYGWLFILSSMVFIDISLVSLVFFPFFSRCFFRWRFDARRHVEPGSDPLRTHHWPPGKWSPVGWCHRGQHLPWYLDRWWTMIKNSGKPTVGGAPPRYKLNGL